VSGKARGFSAGLLLLLAGEQACATARPRETAGGVMLVAGFFAILAGAAAETPCDPADGTDCRFVRVGSGTYEPALIGGGLVVAALGAVLYLGTPAHGSSTSPSPVPPPPAPPASPPSPPIEPLPMDQRL